MNWSFFGGGGGDGSSGAIEPRGFSHADIPTSSLVSAWNFSGLTNTTVPDLVASNNLTLSAYAAEFADIRGIPGYPANSGGLGYFMSVGVQALSGSSGITTGAYSVRVVLREISATAPTTGSTFAWSNSGVTQVKNYITPQAENNHYDCFVDTTNRGDFFRRLADSQVHELVTTHDGSGVYKFYHDGIKLVEYDNTTAVDLTSHNHLAFCTGNTTGLLIEAELFNEELTQANIDALDYLGLHAMYNA